MSIEIPIEAHPAVSAVAKYFEYEHLTREDLKHISRECSNFAQFMINNLPLDNPETTAGLRKLLEAKDCFVRAAI